VNITTAEIDNVLQSINKYKLNPLRVTQYQISNILQESNSMLNSKKLE